MASKFPHQPQMKPIHFFKIITAPSLHEGKLMIPSKFVEKYGAGLPNVLFLKPPNGTEWKINLEKRDGKIWFQKGWKEFAEHHSLAHGHLLVFRCEGTSHFLVHIFDTSALEIDYPLRKEEGRIASNDQGKNAPNDENLPYHRPSKKKKDNSCKMRSSRCAKVENTLILPQAALHHNDTKCKEKATVANQVTALDRASSFQPCNPFFMVVMRKSYVHSCGSPLGLPSKFCKRHFDLHKKSEDISLEVVNGRVWPARCLMRKFNTVTKFRLSGGWKTFSKHNNLKVGDVCTFELIPKSKLTFQVHIFRNTNRSNCSTSQESGQMKVACQGQRKEMKIITEKKATAVERASSFEPCNPFFKVVMHPSYLGSHRSSALSLPSEFCKRHFDLHKKEGDINLQVLNGRVWPVRYLISKINTKTKFRITSGWRTFAKHNNLKIGDVCTFELILRSKLTFEVHIFRETDNSNCSTSQGRIDV